MFGHFNFRTKSSPDIKLVRNFSILMYFNYIEVPHFLDEIKMSQLSDKLMEDFFGKHITERTLCKNPRTGDMQRSLGHIVTKEQDAGKVSFGMSRAAAEETYMCTVDETEDGKGILWMLFDIRHEQLFTVNDLWKCQSTLGEGKTNSKYLCDKML